MDSEVELGHEVEEEGHMGDPDVGHKQEEEGEEGEDGALTDVPDLTSDDEPCGCHLGSSCGCLCAGGSAGKGAP